jgi:hypothetical protein
MRCLCHARLGLMSGTVHDHSREGVQLGSPRGDALESCPFVWFVVGVVGESESGSFDGGWTVSRVTADIKLLPIASHPCDPSKDASVCDVTCRHPVDNQPDGTPSPFASSSECKRRKPLGVSIHAPGLLGIGSRVLCGRCFRASNPSSVGAVFRVFPAPNGRRQFDIGLGGN